jgi:hypothetical protein
MQRAVLTFAFVTSWVILAGLGGWFLLQHNQPAAYACFLVIPADAVAMLVVLRQLPAQ